MMKYPSIEDSLKFLETTTEKDFDGHTNFSELNPEERIRWASISAMAVFKARELRASWKQAENSED